MQVSGKEDRDNVANHIKLRVRYTLKQSKELCSSVYSIVSVMLKKCLQMSLTLFLVLYRYYYHRQILEPVLGKKLVYRFGPNAVQVWENRIYRPQDHGIQYNPREPKSPDKRNKGA